MIGNMLNNKKINPIVIELFFRGRKVNICLFFIIQSSKENQTKFYALLYQENSKQIKT